MHVPMPVVHWPEYCQACLYIHHIRGLLDLPVACAEVLSTQAMPVPAALAFPTSTPSSLDSSVRQADVLQVGICSWCQCLAMVLMLI